MACKICREYSGASPLCSYHESERVREQDEKETQDEIDKLREENKSLQQNLALAVEAIQDFDICSTCSTCESNMKHKEQTLTKIREGKV